MYTSCMLCSVLPFLMHILYLSKKIFVAVANATDRGHLTNANPSKGRGPTIVVANTALPLPTTLSIFSLFLRILLKRLSSTRLWMNFCMDDLKCGFTFIKYHFL